MTSANCDVIVFFRFMVKMQLSRRQNADAQSTKITFSLTIIFYLTKPESRTKTHTIALSKGTIEGTIFAKKMP